MSECTRLESKKSPMGAHDFTRKTSKASKIKGKMKSSSTMICLKCHIFFWRGKIIFIYIYSSSYICVYLERERRRGREREREKESEIDRKRTEKRGSERKRENDT